MMDAVDLNDIPIFLKVVDAGSFTAAARDLGAPKTTVSRRVARLERAVGVRLINRTTRSLSLTDAGRRYYQTCKEGLAVFEEANRQTAEVQQEPTGTIRVSGPADTRFLSDIIADFMMLYPKVSVEIILTDEQVNLVEEGIDIAIRAGQLSDSSLIARKIAPSLRAFVASPAYLERAGIPGTPDDLANHDCIIFGRTIEGATWPVHRQSGPDILPVSGRIAANTMQFVVRAAVAGLGIALIPSPLAARDVRAGRLRNILTGYEPPHGALYAVFPSSRLMPAAVRAFADFVADRMAWLAEPGARLDETATGETPR